MSMLATIEIKDWNDIAERDRLMDEYSDSEFPFHGTNSEGEDITIHITHEAIVTVTYQANGWIRENHYRRSDYTTEELFTGKWC